MRHRAVIYSESDCGIIGRRRGDSDEIIIKQEKVNIILINSTE